MNDKAKILIVDDEEIVRLNIERILEMENYATKTAKSGAEALQKIKQDEFDLVLTDLIMEDIDGLKLLEEVKRDSPDTMVIIITGYGSLSSAVLAMQNGALDYIIKPCEKEELIMRVRNGIEKRKMQQKLLEIKKMEAILSNIGVFILDVKGVITSANNDITGKLWGDISLVGKKLSKLPGVANTGLYDCFEQALSGEEESYKENIKFYSKKDKSEFILSCHSRPISFKNGKPKAIMMIVEDLTRRTKVMQQISQAEKLAALGKLAAGVAHEINNPLNIISLDVEFLKSQIDAYSPLMENLQSIAEEVDRIAHIVKQLRDHAKREDSAQESININEILNSHIFSIAFSQLIKKGIQIELDLEETLPPVVIPRTKITQVLMNMIKNAEDAMESGGKLNICSRRIVKRSNPEQADVRSDSEDLKDLVEIVIKDDGTGIKQEDIKYLFEPFFTTKGFDGTGLGLFISYSIIKSYNGIINVTSEVGKGTSFSIVLPVNYNNQENGASATKKR